MWLNCIRQNGNLACVAKLYQTKRKLGFGERRKDILPSGPTAFWKCVTSLLLPPCNFLIQEKFGENVSWMFVMQVCVICDF